MPSWQWRTQCWLKYSGLKPFKAFRVRTSSLNCSQKEMGKQCRSFSNEMIKSSLWVALVSRNAINLICSLKVSAGGKGSTSTLRIFAKPTPSHNVTSTGSYVSMLCDASVPVSPLPKTPRGCQLQPGNPFLFPDSNLAAAFWQAEVSRPFSKAAPCRVHYSGLIWM